LRSQIKPLLQPFAPLALLQQACPSAPQGGGGL
jgi:hypothetical protein